MKTKLQRASLLLLAALSLAGCVTTGGWPRPNVPTPTKPAPEYTLRVETNPSGATLTNDAQPSQFNPIWVSPQGAAFRLKRTDFNLCAELTGYLRTCVPVGGEIEDKTIVIQMVKAPEPPTPAWRTGAELEAIKSDLGSRLDAHGDLMWMGQTHGAMAVGRWEDWSARWREAGLTHVTVGDFNCCGYPAFPFANPDIHTSSDQIRNVLLRILNTPAADGKGFTPIVQFDGGSYPNSTPRQRIDRDWPVILEAIKGKDGQQDLSDYIIPVPGWELITASDWRSADISYALIWMDAHGLKNLAVHTSPGRTAISSHCGVNNRPDLCIPYDAADWSKGGYEWDDPWRGDEAGSFKSHGGDKVKIHLFQVDPPRPGENLNCDYVRDDRCFLNRFNDFILRVGAGYHGWRKMVTVFYESMVYWAFHGQPFGDYNPGAWSADFARDVATAAKRVCDKPIALEDGGRTVEYPAVTCGWGNGLPWNTVPVQ